MSESTLSDEALAEFVAEAGDSITPEPAPITHLSISIDTIQAVGQYLLSRPMGEVRHLVEAIERDCTNQPEG